MISSTKSPSIELMSLLGFHRILVPIGSSDINHLDCIFEDLTTYIHHSASLILLGLCTMFISDPSGDIASDYQIHQAKVVNAVKQELDRIACQGHIDPSRIITRVREGGPPEVAAEAKRFQADLILLTTPLWTKYSWLHNDASSLKRLTNCTVLLLRS